MASFKGGCWKAISLYCLSTSFTLSVWGFVSRGNTYALNISARNKNKVFQNVKVFIPFLSGRMSNIWGEGLLLTQHFKTVFYNVFLFFFLKIKKKLIYLALPSLSWGMREFYLQHVEWTSLIRDWTQAPLLWERGVLATKPPGKCFPQHLTFRCWVRILIQLLVCERQSQKPKSPKSGIIRETVLPLNWK